MSHRGPQRIEPRFYGRTLKIEVQRHPNKLFALSLFMIALALGCSWLLLNEDHFGPREVLVTFCAPLLFVMGGLMLYGSFAIRSAPPVFLKLGLKKAAIPRGTFAWTLYEEEAPLHRLGPVSRVFQRAGNGLQLAMPDGKKVLIRDDWFPPEHSTHDFGFLLQLRRELAIHRKIDRVAQAALEAQVFEDAADALGVVVDTRKKRPTPIAIVYDLDDYATLMAEDGFPHAHHRLVVASERVEETRDAVEASVLAAFDVDAEKVRSQRPRV